MGAWLERTWAGGKGYSSVSAMGSGQVAWKVDRLAVQKVGEKDSARADSTVGRKGLHWAVARAAKKALRRVVD